MLSIHQVEISFRLTTEGWIKVSMLHVINPYALLEDRKQELAEYKQSHTPEWQL